MILFDLLEGMENCKMSGKKSGKSQGILRWMVSDNPVRGVHCTQSRSLSIWAGKRDELPGASAVAGSVCQLPQVRYRIYLAIRQGFCPSRMISNN